MTRRTLLQALSASMIPGLPLYQSLAFLDANRSSEIVPIDLEHVVIDDAFWAPKRKVWRNTTIRDCMAKFEAWQGGVFNNFDRVRDGEKGNHAGLPWFDGLIYEMIRAVADFMRNEPDAELESVMDSLIARIVAAAAKSPDGYLNTYTQLKEPGHEWGLNGGLEVWQHEFYNAGALVDAGVHYYRATKKTELLQTAVTLANTLSILVSSERGKNLVPSHELPEEAMLALYELLIQFPKLQSELKGANDPKRYLKLAEFWIENRGRNSLAVDWSDRGRAEKAIRAMKDYKDGRPSWGDYAQDRIPILEQTEVVGHAVRSTLLCSALAAVGRVNGNPKYMATATKLWESMALRRMHITGGVGASAYEEAFGEDYALPNNAYLETCASVGAGFFHANMHRNTGQARYADELERVMYNGILCGISLSGDHYTYENPLILDEKRARWNWHDCPCCPPMFLKFMGAMPSYLYAKDAESIYINQFVGSRATIDLSGKPVNISQTTQYPWNGKIRIAVEVENLTQFTLKVRIPAWCEKHSMSINGSKITEAKRTNGYLEIPRTWKTADIVELELEMPIRKEKAHPKVVENKDNVALMRGPLVYCFESCDAPSSEFKPTVTPKAELKLESWEDQLGGVIAIKADSISAIPFFANGNRGPVKMQVWIPLMKE